MKRWRCKFFQLLRNICSWGHIRLSGVWTRYLCSPTAINRQLQSSMHQRKRRPKPWICLNRPAHFGKVRACSFSGCSCFLHRCLSRPINPSWKYNLVDTDSWSCFVLGGIPLTHTPFQHKNHIFFQIHGIRKCDRNIKYSRAALGSNFEIRVVSWRAIFCQFQVRSRASYWNFCLGYIEYFFIGWKVLFTANPDDILSLTQPQISATWRPWRFAFKWPLILRFLSALCLVEYRWPIHPSNIKTIFSSRSTA